MHSAPSIEPLKPLSPGPSRARAREEKFSLLGNQEFGTAQSTRSCKIAEMCSSTFRGLLLSAVGPSVVLRAGFHSLRAAAHAAPLCRAVLLCTEGHVRHMHIMCTCIRTCMTRPAWQRSDSLQQCTHGTASSAQRGAGRHRQVRCTRCCNASAQPCAVRRRHTARTAERAERKALVRIRSTLKPL